ncbi:MAG: class I SAM-dependent DNA methyltransferase [Nocardioides sp.]
MTSVDPTAALAPFAEIYAAALRGEACAVEGWDGQALDLPVHRWQARPDASDLAVLAHCAGATIDVGCGPGRMGSHLAEQGGTVLCVDIVPEAVEQAQARGVSALHRDVFSPLPGEGRWETALLADGNIGIGGDPEALLARVRELLGPGGRAVIDVAPDGYGVQTREVRLRNGSGVTHPFQWTVVGADAVSELARRTGFALIATHRHHSRWFVVLQRKEGRHAPPE